MPKAILSVHDKTGLVDFARGLRALQWTLIASGGTAKLLRESGLPVTEVADYTGSPEILGGRVKTLHPAIHGGLLARGTEVDLGELKRLGWDYIDLVACNLYPFQQTVARPGVTLDEAIENIDIGGVTLIRAAAKNHRRVILCCDPADYDSILEALRAGSADEAMRRRLAVKGFGHTAEYDAAINAYLAGEEEAPLRVFAPFQQKLRYGENPHQTAALYAHKSGTGPLGGKILQGRELSFTNMLDLDCAWRAAVSYERPSVVIVKQVSPCGIASADSLADAFRAALASDPVSAYGAVVAANRPVDGAAVKAAGRVFLECFIAPGFSAEARELLAKRKNCRVLEMPDTVIEPAFEIRSVTRGLLMQASDFGDPPGNPDWKTVSKRAPTAEELADLRFAWKACRFVRSNAIVFAHGEATVGIGGGQPNRVDCVRIAAQRAGERAQGAVMASDAFFPFPDSVQVAAEAGITAAVHPGGSVRDGEAAAAADAAGMAMVVTGVRHFRH
ncbi:MAG: bifunctional phosphoribosylaminoimidazolecarboxamide formyltransferase/IMP cyclohydrolase [Anaerolineales bacterium]|nr:bifunctional phosphoribosylaminoimidazolecarboxamide formyltransferase/IMP cyclohydrolase [Anaerolineales bacterium]